MKKELEGLYEQGVFEEMHKDDIPANAVVLPSKLFFAIKQAGTQNERYKSRYIAGVIVIISKSR